MSGAYAKQPTSLSRTRGYNRSRIMARKSAAYLAKQRLRQSRQGKISDKCVELPAKKPPSDESDSSEEDSEYETKVSRGPTKGLENIRCKFSVAGHDFDERLDKTSLEEVLYYFSDEKTTEEILQLMSNGD